MSLVSPTCPYASIVRCINTAYDSLTGPFRMTAHKRNATAFLIRAMAHHNVGY